LRSQEKEIGDSSPRREVQRRLADLDTDVKRCEEQRAQLRREIRAVTHADQALDARRAIERIDREAELERLGLARRALLTRNMELGNRRPTGWWFTIADPSGQWFREAIRLSEVWLEDLRSQPAEA